MFWKVCVLILSQMPFQQVKAALISETGWDDVPGLENLIFFLTFTATGRPKYVSPRGCWARKNWLSRWDTETKTCSNVFQIAQRYIKHTDLKYWKESAGLRAVARPLPWAHVEAESLMGQASGVRRKLQHIQQMATKTFSEAVLQIRRQLEAKQPWFCCDDRSYLCGSTTVFISERLKIAQTVCKMSNLPLEGSKFRLESTWGQVLGVVIIFYSVCSK